MNKPYETQERQDGPVKYIIEFRRDQYPDTYHAMEALNAGDWHCLGICVKAYIGSEEIAADSLWGIESSWDDPVWGWGQDYSDIIEDMIVTCKGQFSDTLKRIESVAEVLKEII